MNYIFPYLKKYTGRMIFGLVIKVTGTIVDLLIPRILAHMIDEIVPTKDTNLLLLYGGIMIFCAIIGFSFNVIANRMASKVASLCAIDIRKDTFSHIMYMDLDLTDQIGIPSLISRMTTDTYNITNFIGMLQRLGVRAPILLLGGIIFSAFLNWELTMILIISLPIMIAIIVLVSKFGMPLFHKVQVALDRLVMMIREDSTGIKVIKALGKEEYEAEQFKTAVTTHSKLEQKANRSMATINPLLNLVMNFGLIAVLYIGANLVFKGRIEKGVILAFLTYFTIILNALLAITRMFIVYSKASASAKRVKEVMLLKNKIEKIECEDTSEHFIEFRNINFSFHNTKNVLENISFTLKEGESLGIIGPTGCGKSTIIALLLRLYDVSEGAIYLDGKNIKSISKEELYSQLGIVFQSDFLSGTTILENIDFGRNYEFTQIEEATMHAQAHDFVTSKGFAQKLSAKGSNLSGGQKQRILISRAMAGNPKLLILDDSSSALDYKTDQALRNTIASAFKDTTSIIISSRISSIKDCDKILVMEEGRIVAAGTHDEVLSTSSTYREIKDLQMGGEIHEF